MEKETPLNTHELVPKIVVAPRAAESLLHPENPDSLWPEEIKNNPELQKQAGIRLEAKKQLDSLFAQVPRADMEMEEAIDERLITSEQLAATYEKLADVLEADPYNARMVLYLPTELLARKEWNPKFPALKEARERFTSIYLKLWDGLLDIVDVRANFVDGDVLERELREVPLPEVVKAAHLIPKLAEKGLISIPKILDMAEDNPRSVLKTSILEAVAVLADMDLLSPRDRERIEKLTTEHTTTEQTSVPKPEKVTEARAQWLQSEQVRRAIETSSDRIAENIGGNTISPTELNNLLSLDHALPEILANIHGIRKAVENRSHESAEKAVELANAYEETLNALLERNVPEITDALTSAWFRWTALGVLAKTYTEQRGIKIPKPNESFSEGRSAIQEEVTEVEAIMRTIETDPELSKFFYPTSILFGSRIKGYGTNTADLDVALFIRPGVSVEDQPKIQALMAKLLETEKIKGKAVEFWLEEDGGQTRIQDLYEAEGVVGGPNWSHVLFEGVWCGTEDSLKKMHEQLLPAYLYSEGGKIRGRDARKMWLEEMERDTLQYRLMHKGYARFFPEQGGMKTEHADAVDGKSTFWDSGYRRMATQLFLDRVFLPQLKK